MKQEVNTLSSLLIVFLSDAKTYKTGYAFVLFDRNLCAWCAQDATQEHGVLPFIPHT